MQRCCSAACLLYLCVACLLLPLTSLDVVRLWCAVPNRLLVVSLDCGLAIHLGSHPERHHPWHHLCSHQPAQAACQTIFISDSACIARRDGILKFMFRVADIRKTQVSNAHKHSSQNVTVLSRDTALLSLWQRLL